MQAIEQNNSIFIRTLIWGAVLFFFNMFAIPAKGICADGDLSVQISTGYGTGINFWDNELDEYWHHHLPISLDIGYYIKENDSLSFEVQASFPWLEKALFGRAFPPFVVASFNWRHFFPFKKFSLFTIGGLGGGLIIVPYKNEDLVIGGPVVLQFGAGAIFQATEAFLLGVEMRFRIPVPAHFRWVGGVLLVNFQYRFEL